MTRITSFALLLFLLGAPTQAREDLAVCGTYPERSREELFLHRQSVRARQAAGIESVRRTTPAAARDIGHLAILEDLDGVVARRNDFNLDRRSLVFTPAAAGATRYRFQTGSSNYDSQAAASGGPLSGLDDDDSREMALPFAFPFFGKSYTRVFVNSDGNLTFGAGDKATSERSLGRLTAGPPRIAGLFRDLDPSLVANSVRVLAEATRFVVSWIDVPEYQPVGFGITQTFQILLTPDGRMEFHFERVTTRTAVVGIAPGGVLGATSVVSFSQGSGQEFTAAIAERFTSVEEIDIVLAAQKFYETHDDAYDYLAIFNTMGISAAPGAVAFEVTVRNDRTGYGDSIVDIGREFGSARRLQAVLNLGPINQYPVDPNAVVPSRSLSRDTPLTILGHEAGHLFLAFASVRDPVDPLARPMLGRQTAHWNFAFNSEASLLEGNRIRDDGPQASPRFTTVATVEGYAPLDQYLMGLRAPEEVPLTFLVENPTTAAGSRQPQTGVSFNGRRRDVSIEELMAAEGRRTPDHTVAQRRFRLAFILVTAAGVDLPSDPISQVEAYRQAFESFFSRVTDQRAIADTALRRSLRLSTFPAAGVVAGSAMTATVSVARAPEAPLTVLLRAAGGAITVPSSVTIPAGATQAGFEVRGARVGVDELIAEPADTRYDQAQTRVQVLASVNGLRLAVFSGDRQPATPGVPLLQPVVLRVADANNLPYPGLRVNATVTAPGALERSDATADEDGLVRFVWTPAAAPLNELRATVEGSNPPVTAAVSAVGRPFLAPGGVVNAASYAPGLALGAMQTLFGANLAAGAQPVVSFPLSDRVADTRVLVNGQPAQLFYVSDRQINFVMPLSAPGSVDIVVSNPAGASTPARLTVEQTLPGIFFDPETNAAAVLVAGAGQTTLDRPAAAGDVLEIYCTGLGPLGPSSLPGLQETVGRSRVTIAGLDAEVLFSGATSALPGLYQVNARVPPGLAAGSQPLAVLIDGKSSNVVNVRLR